MKRKQIYALFLVALVVGGAVALIAKNAHAKPVQQTAQSIPMSTRFAEVQKLSVGQKPACLTRTASLDSITAADDTLPYEQSFSPAIGTVIPDMPAGYTDVFLHAYTPTRASGYEVFSDKNQKLFAGNLRSFNFSVKRSDDKAMWTLVSFTACS